MAETRVERRLTAIVAAHVAGYPRRASRINWLICRWYVVLLSAMVLALQSLTAPTWAQMLKDLKCTGKSDIPWADQIVGCSNAITSGTFAGKDLAAALTNRGTAYVARGNADRALADFNEAIKLDPNAAGAFFGRGITYFIKKDYDHAIADYTEKIRLDPN